MLQTGLKGFMVLELILSVMVFTIPTSPLNAVNTIYYVDAAVGRDVNNGTSEGTAWETLAKVGTMTFGPGDRILFRRGCQFTGTMILRGNGTPGTPVTIDAYGKGNKPIIISSDIGGINNNPQNKAAIKLTNMSYWTIQNIEVQAPCSYGILLLGCTKIIIQDCEFTNVKYMPGGQDENSDSGVAVWVGPGSTDGSDIIVDNCIFRRCDHGVWITSGNNVILQNSYFYDIYSVGALFAGHIYSPNRTVTNSRIRNCIFDYVNTRSGGWNPVMLGGTDSCFQEFCEIKNCPDGSNDHQVYDFDTNCRNTYIQYNYSHDNYGTLFHSYWVGKRNGPCYFRYNISVNERFILSHFHNSYGLQMYNNVFYNFDGWNSGLRHYMRATDLINAVVKNNIFYLKPGTRIDSLPEGSGNNCFYNCPVPVGSPNSIQANPLFLNTSNPVWGLQIKSDSPLRNAGTLISNSGGIDYFGNKLYNGDPDIGVHEYWFASLAKTGNLALNCVVSTSSSRDSVGWHMLKLTDGTVNSVRNTMGWSSNGNEKMNHEEWITIDLGANCRINRVILYPRNDYGHLGENFPMNFQIRTSRDSIKWKVVSNQSDYNQPGNAPQYFSFANQDARYVNITCRRLRKDPANSYFATFDEIEVLNDISPVPQIYEPSGNLALSRDVLSLSSSEKRGWFKVKLTDGMRSTVSKAMGWSSAPGTSAPQWVGVDLGAVCKVSKVDLYPRNDPDHTGSDFPVNFTIQTSTDNLNWTTIVTRTDFPRSTDGLVRSFHFPTVSARFVRVYATTLDSSGLMSLSEIEIYN